MGLNSINTNVSAYYAQQNIGKASTSASSSIARLSSGNRIVRAADDVAAMSAGTSLKTNVTTLRMALINTSQGSSLLQVADGALQQVTDILQRQKAIAVQAGSGSLTSSERSFLNQEFQNLTEEIDRLANQTNFNGVDLLNGKLFDVTNVTTADTIAQQGTASLTFVAANLAAAKTIVIGGVSFAANAAPTGNQFLAASATVTLAESVQSLANVLNASTDLNVSSATYKAVGGSLQITNRVGGSMGETLTIDLTSTSLAAGSSYSGKILTDGAGASLNRLALAAPSNVGIAKGDTIGTGTIGDSIVTTQNQLASNVSLNFTNAVFADFADAKTISLHSGTAALKLELDNNAAVGAGNIAIDTTGLTTKSEVLDAIVRTVNTYNGTAGWVLNQLEATRSGDVITLTRKDVGNVTTFAGAAVTATATTIANTTLTGSTTFANGASTGITTSGVSNSAFVGTIQGFSAEYTGTANRANISVTVGDRTYTAANVNTAAGTVAVPSVTRFFSTEGDYFDVGLTGATVSNQTDADTLATRLNKAFSTITFTQRREVNSYNAAGDIFSEGATIGSLTGTTVELQSDKTGPFTIDSVSVRSPLTGQTNGTIELVINGVTYRSEGNIGSSLARNSVHRFTSLENANDVIKFTVGNTAIQFNTAGRAQAVEDAFTKAFGIGEGGASLNFQVGVTTSDTLDVSIGSVTTAKIFSGSTLDVLTAESAAAAADILDAAIDAVTAVRAEVGALQSRFDFAAANVESSIQNQDAARGVLLDTDIAAESSAFASAQVKLQAGISVLAQANQLPQNLLKLIG